ncbi:MULTISPECIES: hypothetical protein [unclassified Actinomyces]|uniref:hypothetical protein n=1 Tax=unclassified Actinomyces TaxID=2609248 RepID=UPI002017DE80|nr:MULTISPECIES: hypothetical protein [unclassified Actinomyces]MCL3776811.1 hypothetical protein [Actinomyces sp. AC-20-1]MCL3789720.1 hypothetical protein [Actinomyces sp. 187325]MCL3792077.1 hypothetical protein [Actinomyces sp. 186855]MCL3794744.1 hypothetical protein [Actinomyces sp. 217892]
MSQVPPSSGSPYSPAPYGQGEPGTSPYTTPSASSAPGAYPPAGQGGYGQPYAQQAPAYGAPTYPTAPAYGTPAGYGAGPVPQVRPTTGPKILLTIGLVMLIGSIVAFAVSLATLLNVSGSLSEIPRNGTATATLESSNVYGIYSGGLIACEVADPSGAPVDVTSVPPSDATDVDGNPLIGIFSPTTSGDYTITCQSSSSKPVYLGLSVNGSGAIASGLGIIGSFLLGLPGLFLTIGGFIWLGVRRSQNKQAQAAAGGYPGARF